MRSTMLPSLNAIEPESAPNHAFDACFREQHWCRNEKSYVPNMNPYMPLYESNIYITG